MVTDSELQLCILELAQYYAAKAMWDVPASALWLMRYWSTPGASLYVASASPEYPGNMKRIEFWNSTYVKEEGFFSIPGTDNFQAGCVYRVPVPAKSWEKLSMVEQVAEALKVMQIDQISLKMLEENCNISWVKDQKLKYLSGDTTMYDYFLNWEKH